MSGVEILKETAIYENTLCAWLCAFFWVVALACFISSLSSLSYYITGKDKVDMYSGIITLVLAVASSLLFIYGLFPSQKVAYIEYQVTIDDSVSFNEFIEKYEIIDSEGKIYTVKEK